MSAIRSENGYSAAVQLRLEFNGTKFRIAQIGECFLVLGDPCEAAPGTKADVLITIDGEECTYPVVLHEGIFPFSEVVEFTNLDDCNVSKAAGV